MQSASNSDGLDLVMDFNFRPLSYLDYSWLTGLPESITSLMKLVEEPARDADVSQQVNQALDIHNDYFFDFDDPITQVALLGKLQLRRVIYLAGLALLQNDIRRVVTRQEVQRLNQAVSEKDLEFVTRRASRLTKGLDLEVLPVKPVRVEFNTQAELLGLQCLGASLENYPHALQKRVMLKLPRTWERSFNNRIISFPEGFCEQYIRKIAAYRVLRGENR